MCTHSPTHARHHHHHPQLGQHVALCVAELELVRPARWAERCLSFGAAARGRTVQALHALTRADTSAAHWCRPRPCESPAVDGGLVVSRLHGPMFGGSMCVVQCNRRALDEPCPPQAAPRCTAIWPPVPLLATASHAVLPRALISDPRSNRLPTCAPSALDVCMAHAHGNPTKGTRKLPRPRHAALARMHSMTTQAGGCAPRSSAHAQPSSWFACL